MEIKNAEQKSFGFDDENAELNFSDLEKFCKDELDADLLELSTLQEEAEKIGNPDNLGEVIGDVICDQVNLQIASVAGEDFIKENHGLRLDLRDSAHIQTAGNFAKGKIAIHNCISKEQLEQNSGRYKNTPHRKFRKKFVDPGMNATLKRAGELNKQGVETVKNIYTGKQITTKTKLENGKNNPQAAQREHVISSAEQYGNPSLQMANSSEELAAIINNPENLQGYTTAERNNRKSDSSANEMREQDKTKHWEKANERAEKYSKQKEKEGEERLKQEGRKTQKEEAFRIGGKALRAVIMSLLAELLREIIAQLIKWFKSGKKKMSTLLDSLKKAISSFLSKIKQHLLNAGKTIVDTVATAIFGPIYRTIKKAWLLLKQGWNSLKNAINYIKNPENKGKPIDRLLLEVGKIIVAGLAGGGAMVLGEVIEKSLLSVCPLIFGVEIPFLGSLASILGIFLGAVVSGIIGAIAINLIEKKIKSDLDKRNRSEQIDKGNDIIKKQEIYEDILTRKKEVNKSKVAQSMTNRHCDVTIQLLSICDSIDKNCQSNPKLDETLENL